MSEKIYYINRYDLHKPKHVRDNSGYEQIVKYNSNFKRIKPNKLLSDIIFFLIKNYIPKGYLRLNLGKEIVGLVKGLISGSPIFYLYADKDALLLPLIKERFNLKRLKLFGTLHWPIEISQEFSFYKHNLASEFDGIIGLSSSTLNLNHKNLKIIPHGIDLSFWKKSNSFINENLYLIIGISNRNHIKQANIIKKIKQIDSEAKFLLIAKNKAVQKIYKDIPYIEKKADFIIDAELKRYYEKAKAVILFQNHCLASNVVLESIVMGVPLITNLVGDINEYLGDDYPLYIDEDNEEMKLKEFCLFDPLRDEIKDRFESMSSRFDWKHITKSTIDFIEQN